MYQRANMARAISFEYLNRQLVWHELSELLLFVLPLISVTRLKRMIVNRWPSLRAATGTHPQECGHLHFVQRFDVCSCCHSVCCLVFCECMPSLHPQELLIHRHCKLFMLLYSCECCDCLTVCIVLQPSIFSVPPAWKVNYQARTIRPCLDLVQSVQRMRSLYLSVHCLASTPSATTVYVPIVKQTTISPAQHVPPEWTP